MNFWPILILLGVNSLLILGMLIILVAIIRQGKRITRLADDTRDRVRQIGEEEWAEPPTEESGN